jgi:hypothetical protein
VHPALGQPNGAIRMLRSVTAKRCNQDGLLVAAANAGEVPFGPDELSVMLPAKGSSAA